MTVQLYVNDFTDAMRAMYVCLISCSVMLVQPISICLSVLFIVLSLFLFVFFSILFQLLFIFRMCFMICINIKCMYCPTPCTGFIYIYHNIVYPKLLFMCSSSFIYLGLQLIQIMYVSFSSSSVMFSYIYIYIYTYSSISNYLNGQSFSKFMHHKQPFV